MKTPVSIDEGAPLIASQSAEQAVVNRVIDGDTIELLDGRRVRYIGMDTPELGSLSIKDQCFAQEATEKNKELVQGKEVKLLKDISETDKYKRLLRFVWVDGLFVNEYLLQEGFAKLESVPPDITYQNVFHAAEVKAKQEHIGLWKSCR